MDQQSGAGGAAFLADEDPAGAEEAARRRLRRNRSLATGLLGSAGAVFAATHLVDDPGFWTLLIRTAAEAGVVGGLADWFAVTALFRRPLGLPIPHTAIIPSNKERIGRALGRFVERNFLTPEVLVPKLREIGVGRRFAAWLAEPDTAALLARSVADALPYLVHSLDSADLHDFVRRTLGEQLTQADIAPLLARVITATTASGEADVLFERVVGIAERWLRENHTQIDRLVQQRSRWWIPRSVDRKIADAIVLGVVDLLAQLRQPDSDVRHRFRAAVAELATEIVESPDRRRVVNESKNRILGHPEVQAWLGTLWSQLSAAILSDIPNPESKVRKGLERVLITVGGALAADPAMQRHIDSAVERLALRLTSWRGGIGDFIADVVGNWDAVTLSDRLELVVGSDLQYIRMNGTIVGALAGCLIFLLGQLLS